MTAKVILSMDGTIIREYPLNKERITIGRKLHNEIVIDNLAISGEHAAIVTILNDSFLEDLDSTNGVEVNGTPIKKHFLQNNDLIELGKYKLKYINEQASQPNAADFERTMVLRKPVTPTAGGKPAETPRPMPTGEATGKISMPPRPTQPAAPSAPAAPATTQVAVVQILNGPNAGRELELVKSLTTLGKPGVQVAVLTRRPHGFFITHVEGSNHPSVNSQVLSDQPHQLNDHDVIELAGVKMEFYYKS